MRLTGRFGSSATDALGGSLPKSTAGAVSTCTVTFTGAVGADVGASGCTQDCSVLYPCAGGGAETHCGCSGTFGPWAVPNPAIFPHHLLR